MVGGCGVVLVAIGGGLVAAGAYALALGSSGGLASWWAGLFAAGAIAIFVGVHFIFSAFRER